MRFLRECIFVRDVGQNAFHEMVFKRVEVVKPDDDKKLK